ncbi:MAG: hypothetical protein WDO15_21355 [Bacteroidota bacterium]
MKQRTTKSVILLLLAMTLSLGSFAAPTSNEVIPAATNPSESANAAEMQRLTNRLEEIKAMDLKNMPRSEKRKYGKEVKQIQKKMNALSGGVYISAGALLVVLILLLILL